MLHRLRDCLWKLQQLSASKVMTVESGFLREPFKPKNLGQDWADGPELLGAGVPPLTPLRSYLSKLLVGFSGPAALAFIENSQVFWAFS